MPKPSNVNDRFRTLRTDRVVHPPWAMPQGIKSLPQRVTTRDRHFSAGHVRNVVGYLPYIRRCQDNARPPRGVPKKVLETFVSLCLV